MGQENGLGQSHATQAASQASLGTKITGAIYAKTVTNNSWGLGLPWAMFWLWLSRVPYLPPLLSFPQTQAS